MYSYHSIHNQQVTKFLVEQLQSKYMDKYKESQIKSIYTYQKSTRPNFIFITIECVHRYYESRRRVTLDCTPERKEKKEVSSRKFRKIQRQKSVVILLLILNLILISIAL